MVKNAFEEDELDTLVAHCGGKLIVPDMGIMEAIGEPLSLLLDNGDVVLDEVVERNGGKFDMADTGFVIGEAVL